MKNKHLLLTMAFATAFAACTNEELIENKAQQKVPFERPTVENVTFQTSLGSTAETRVAYGADGYAWEVGDTLGVILMDESKNEFGSATFPKEWNELSWYQKYGLVNYCHTHYAYVAENVDNELTWVKSGKFEVLEGNYFLAYPGPKYVTFNGHRQPYYEIATQTQIGNTGAGRTAAYTDNQIFVGYGRVKIGDPDNIVKTSMAEILTAVRINIVSDCKDDLLVKKIVLRHPSFSKQITIDPTTAYYNRWNLANSEDFNYANYLKATGLDAEATEELYDYKMWGSEADEDYVYNAGEFGDVTADFRDRIDAYYWDDAIRSIVKPLWGFNNSDNTTGYVEVYTKDTEDAEGMILGDNELGIIAMVPTWGLGDYTDEPIYLEIHTDKGITDQQIDLSVEHMSQSEIQTVGSITTLHPSMNLKDCMVKVYVDDEDFDVSPTAKFINNADDLKDLIGWLQQAGIRKPLAVMLENDLTIDDDMAKMIKDVAVENGGCLEFLAITTLDRQNSVKLAVKEESDILNYVEILGEQTLVEVNDGAVVTLTEDAHNFMHGDGFVMPLAIQVNKGGVLDIEDNNKSVDGWGVQNGTFNEYYDVTIYNEGTVNAKAQNIAGIFLVNEGVMNVTGSINLAKHEEDLSVNTVKGQINVAVGATLTGTTSNNVLNYGVIENKGRIYNIANLDIDRENTSATTFIPGNIKPGQVIVADGNAVTQLETNEGKVTYAVLTGSNNVILRDNNGSKGIFEYLYDGTGNLNESTLAKAYVTDLTLTKNASISDDKAGESNLRHIVATNGVTIKKAGNGDGKLIFASYDFGGKRNTMNLTGSTNAVVIDGVSFENCPTIVIAGKSTWKGTFNFGTNVELNAVKGEVANGANVTAVSLIVTDNKSSWIENHGTIYVSSYDDQHIQVSHNPI